MFVEDTESREYGNLHFYHLRISMVALEPLLIFITCLSLCKRYNALVHIASAVTCSKSIIEIPTYMNMSPVTCGEQRGEELVMAPVLPRGLYFSNNTLLGSPKETLETTLFTVSTKDGSGDPFFLQIGGAFGIKR